LARLTPPPPPPRPNKDGINSLSPNPPKPRFPQNSGSPSIQKIFTPDPSVMPPSRPQPFSRLQLSNQRNSQENSFRSRTEISPQTRKERQSVDKPSRMDSKFGFNRNVRRQSGPPPPMLTRSEWVKASTIGGASESALRFSNNGSAFVLCVCV
jgi:hypothetical protein